VDGATQGYGERIVVLKLESPTAARSRRMYVEEVTDGSSVDPVRRASHT
jgi:hypothetical protein